VLQNRDLVFNRFDGTQFLSGRQLARLYVKHLDSNLNKEVFLALGKKFVSWAQITQIASDLAGSSGRIVIRGDSQTKPFYYNVSMMERVFGLSFA